MTPDKEFSPEDAEEFTNSQPGLPKLYPDWKMLCFKLMADFANKKTFELATHRDRLEDALREIQAIPYTEYADTEAGKLIADIVSAALKPPV